jgi:hypothetical protein
LFLAPLPLAGRHPFETMPIRRRHLSIYATELRQSATPPSAIITPDRAAAGAPFFALFSRFFAAAFTTLFFAADPDY